MEDEKWTDERLLDSIHNHVDIAKCQLAKVELAIRGYSQSGPKRGSIMETLAIIDALILKLKERGR